MENRLVLWLSSWFTIPLAGHLSLLYTFVFICRAYCLGDVSTCYSSPQWALSSRNSGWNCTSLSVSSGSPHSSERQQDSCIFLEFKSPIKEMQIYKFTFWGQYISAFFTSFNCSLSQIANALSCGNIFLFFRKDHYILSAMKLASVLKYTNLVPKLKSPWPEMHGGFQNLSQYLGILIASWMNAQGIQGRKGNSGKCLWADLDNGRTTVLITDILTPK